MIRSRQILGATVGAVLGLSATVNAQEQVVIAEPTWTGARLMANLIKVVIEDEFGVPAETVPGTNPVVFAAMDRGAGDIDVHPDVWLPNIQNLVDEYVDGRGTVVLSENFYEGQAGFCVATDVAEQLNIRSVFDLATAEAAANFDTTGDGRGEIWVGASGWAVTNTRTVKVRDYGIGAFFDVTFEEEEFAYARVTDAVRNGQPVVFSCYTPHYLWHVHDLTMLHEPPYDPEKHKPIQPSEDPNWFENAVVETADPPQKMYVAYSRSLENRLPIVADFLSRIDMDSDTVGEWTYEVVVQGRAPIDVVRNWVNDNRARVEEWLGL